jgi:hypothetical protein
VDTAAGTITRVFSQGTLQDQWLEGFLRRAYEAHRIDRDHRIDNLNLVGPARWPEEIPDNAIQFYLDKLDWYQVEFSTCKIDEGL